MLLPLPPARLHAAAGPRWALARERLRAQEPAEAQAHESENGAATATATATATASLCACATLRLPTMRASASERALRACCSLQRRCVARAAPLPAHLHLNSRCAFPLRDAQVYQDAARFDMPEAALLRLVNAFVTSHNFPPLAARPAGGFASSGIVPASAPLFAGAKRREPERPGGSARVAVQAAAAPHAPGPASFLAPAPGQAQAQAQAQAPASAPVPAPAPAPAPASASALAAAYALAATASASSSAAASSAAARLGASAAWVDTKEAKRARTPGAASLSFQTPSAAAGAAMGAAPTGARSLAPPALPVPVPPTAIVSSSSSSSATDAPSSRSAGEQRKIDEYMR